MQQALRAAGTGGARLRARFCFPAPGKNCRVRPTIAILVNALFTLRPVIFA